jgi:hypothetical protein
MARIDQVRSYLEKLAASDWPGAVMDQNGQIRIRNGTATVSISASELLPDREDVVLVASTVATKVPDTPALFKWLNEQNRRFAKIKIVKKDDYIAAWASLSPDDVDERQLKKAVLDVGAFADEIDEQIVATYGGQLPQHQPA